MSDNESSEERLAARTMGERRNIALIAHANRKEDILDWSRFNQAILGEHVLFATGTTGSMLSEELGLSVTRFKSWPLGGDQQIGAKVTEGDLDFVIFFWDPFESQPHDVDVKALLRIAVVYNIPVACNRVSADFIITSPLMSQSYERPLIDYQHRMQSEL